LPIAPVDDAQLNNGSKALSRRRKLAQGGAKQPIQINPPVQAFSPKTGQRDGKPMNSLYANMARWSPHVLSILRIVAALLFLEHGLSKVIGFPTPGPPLHGLLILAAILETVGSLLLLAGVYTRIVAFILSGQMALAYFMAHAPRGFFPLANGGQGAILFCFIFLYLAFAGGGPWSVDRAVLKQD
jgi:putative oxidoreductase